ncbi:MAG: flagellar protein FliS [Lachnospiraceae bacterium]|jgi:flagellar protein FliS|nr:flagellar protein FliS [Lachnospiraceae bacterium]
MTKEKKQEYTLRITQANKTTLVVILYEMLLFYIDEAIEMYEGANRKEFRLAIARTRNCLNELMVSLNLEYEIAVRLLELYMFINKELARAEARADIVHLNNAAKIVKELHRTYREVSKNDCSGAVMQNTQAVYSGLTYDRGQAIDSLTNNVNRGYRA